MDGTMETEIIRTRTKKKLLELGISIPASLPILEVLSIERSKKKMGDRLMCMHVAAACAYGFDRTKAINWIDSEGIAYELSHEERDFIYNDGVSAHHLQEQIEGMWALSWAISLHHTLDFSKPCSDTFFFLLPNLKQNQPSSEMRARILVRTCAEILGALDLAYCLHWFVRDCELQSKTIALPTEAYVVAERRKALEWLMSNENWDDLSLDT
jgi:hypothetical protein